MVRSTFMTKRHIISDKLKEISPIAFANIVGSSRVSGEMCFPTVLCLFYWQFFYFCPSLLSLSVPNVLVMLTNLLSKDVQALLGHSDVNTPMNVYAHATREAKRDSAKP